MAKVVSKIILVVQILLVALPTFSFLGFTSSFLGSMGTIIGLFTSGIYDDLESFLTIMLPLFVAGAIFAYFAKSRSLLYGHVFLLFLAFAVLVLFNLTIPFF